MIRQILWTLFGQKEWHCQECRYKEPVVWKNGGVYAEHQCQKTWMAVTRSCNDPKVIARGRNAPVAKW